MESTPNNPLAPPSPHSADDERRPATPGRRLTIAVLLDHLNVFGGGYEAQLREALETRCRADGHNLLLLYGAALEGFAPGGSSDNAIFKVLRPGAFDGIIVVSTLLGGYSSTERVAELVAGYRPTPMCSIGVELAGIPSIILDNRSGMEDAVTHLVRDHGRRRLAFLGGPPKNVEAVARFQAYQTVLDRHGIPFDPALVACGYFHPSVGRVAMTEILGRTMDVDGVVASNDSMAVSAIDVLHQAGRRVPHDIVVTGFDDLDLARLCNPPLTTVAQPFDVFADLAIGAIVDQLHGQNPPACQQVSSRFIRRLSCGCGYHAGPRQEDTLSPREATAAAIPERLALLAPKLVELLHTRTDDGQRPSRCLLGGIAAEAAGQEGAFTQALSELLPCMGDDDEGHHGLQSAIACLHDGLQGAIDLHLERALFNGLGLVALSGTTTQMRHRLALDDNYLRLLTVGENASAALDLSSLTEALVHSLPAAGVRTSFLSCAHGKSGEVASGEYPAQLAATVCLLDGVAVQPPLACFPACRLIPPGVLPADRRRTLLVFPMAIEGQLLGVIAFDAADGTHAYTAFRNEITAVLRSIRLHQELVEETQRREHSVQERVAATKRMEALSVLAGGVAHDLNNALGPLVALPDVILDELGRLGLPAKSLGALREDVESIKTASLRAVQTIKDLLTLGRQGRTVKERLDLNQVVRAALADSSLRFAKEGQVRVNLVVDYAASALILSGSEAQLARAVANLVRNAAEAIAADGEITVKTALAEVAATLPAYESIPAGQYAVLSVSDNGCGIDEQALAHVFEPFFTKKRAGDGSGSGLGLAIVHGVVKEHEGFVDVVTSPQGSTFSLYLPLARPRFEQANQPADAAQGQTRILVVDDEAVQLRTCRRLLERLGYRVQTLESGLRAYEIFNQAAPSGESPFDLVIMDMVLGEMLDGLQIFELIQRLFPAQKAIVVSGHAPNERAELAVKKGLTWLAKPYSAQALACAVERVLRGNGGD